MLRFFLFLQFFSLYSIFFLVPNSSHTQANTTSISILNLNAIKPNCQRYMYIKNEMNIFFFWQRMDWILDDFHPRVCRFGCVWCRLHKGSKIVEKYATQEIVIRLFSFLCANANGCRCRLPFKIYWHRILAIAFWRFSFTLFIVAIFIMSFIHVGEERFILMCVIAWVF